MQNGNGIHGKPFTQIAALITPDSKVLDLGCGKGVLLATLAREKRVRGRGIDINEENIISCIKQGISVFQGDIDEGLLEYQDKSYDYVIMSQTLQVIRRPLYVIQEMVRVGKKGIICFPNFAYWRIRCQLFFQGKMPRTRAIPFEWYDTPNIHHLTIKDFKKLCRDHAIHILKEIPLAPQNRSYQTVPLWCANLFAAEALFIIEK